MEFELVLPCYNESASLETLIERAVNAATDEGYTPESFRLVLVNNGSTDDSQDRMKELASGPLGVWFRTVTVKVNQGYGLGVWSGLRTTTADYVGWSHADMQCDPNDAFAALKLLKKQTSPTLVKGVRSGRSLKDIFVSRVFEVFARGLLGVRVYEINAQPKVFPKALLSEILSPPFTFAFDLYVLYRAAKAGYVTKTIPVLFPPRIHGMSKWAFSFFSRYKTILGMIQYMWRLSRTEGRL